jgi:hypothetical protein
MSQPRSGSPRTLQLSPDRTSAGLRLKPPGLIQVADGREEQAVDVVSNPPLGFRSAELSLVLSSSPAMRGRPGKGPRSDGAGEGVRRFWRDSALDALDQGRQRPRGLQREGGRGREPPRRARQSRHRPRLHEIRTAFRASETVEIDRCQREARCRQGGDATRPAATPHRRGSGSTPSGIRSSRSPRQPTLTSLSSA